MTICLVTDRRQLSPDARTVRDEASALSGWLEQAIAAGVDLIQLRERDLPARLLADLTRRVSRVAAGSGTRVVVNDRADVAIACGCDGVHLRGDGPPVARMRGVVARSGSYDRDPRSFLIGRSVHSAEEAQTHADADYLVFGAVFDSGSKPGLGLAALRNAAANSVGVIAIGGITIARASECIAAGASGVAAIRLFLPPGRAVGGLGVGEATRQLRAAFDAAATGHLQ
ncbi:MAG TPA: thiamine phosphate synthase [Vicinamibacterales bacterium]|nr:thiamine phosphate synthase [Vicinamibacterales bacterium]